MDHCYTSVGLGWTRFDECSYHLYFSEDRKQFAYLGPGVGSLAQPPGGAVGGDGEAAGVVAVLGGEDRSAG